MFKQNKVDIDSSKNHQDPTFDSYFLTNLSMERKESFGENQQFSCRQSYVQQLDSFCKPVAQYTPSNSLPTISEINQEQKYFENTLQKNAQPIESSKQSVDQGKKKSSKSNSEANISSLNVKNEKIASTIQLSNCAKQIQGIKGNVKNAYIKKIASMLSDSANDIINLEQLQDEFYDSSCSDNEKKNIVNQLNLFGSDVKQMPVKHKRLRESAKNSRLRKKFYIKLLENKVNELLSQIAVLREQTISPFEIISKLIKKNDHSEGMIIEQNDMGQKMNDILCDDNHDQMQYLFDSYMNRFGVTGMVRKNYMEFCFKNLGFEFFRTHYRYLLVGMDKKPINYDQEFDQFTNNAALYLGIRDETNVYKLLPSIHKLLQHRHQAKFLYKRLQGNFANLKEKQFKVEDVMTQIMGILTPSQRIKLLKETINHYFHSSNLFPISGFIRGRITND